MDNKTDKIDVGLVFEEKHGSMNLMKAGYSALTHVLVNKGLITEEELLEAFNKEAKEQVKEQVKEQAPQKENNVHILNVELLNLK